KSPVDTLIKHKYLKSIKIASDENCLFLDDEYFPSQPKSLNKYQQESFDKISQDIEKEKFSTHLIYGVTGSGKTEVYMQAIQKALDMGKSAIMLVPEIALTSQTIERFKARFQNRLAILHSKRSQGEKNKAWQEVFDDEAKIIIGARSAIFAPVKNLGIVIVDEEHDSSYKQSEEMPTYNAKHIAVMRGQKHHCPIVLASATPSIESYHKALNKKYLLSILPNRATSSSLPKVHIIDMKEELQKMKCFSHFSQKLLDGIKKRYLLGEQTILFLNKRGYHRFLICKKCANKLKCPHCDISLIFHKKESALSCHSCGYTIAPPKTCPACGNNEYMQYQGFGTEHVEASLKAIFPDIRTLRIDADTTKNKNSHEMLLKQFRSGKADVLIGTQMVVKGLHFPSVSLVGVLNTDGALNIPDFRSSENVFSLITQVAGRAGREEIEGEVIIQTFHPDNSTIKLAATQDYETFYETENESRELFDYPPHSGMIKIVFSGKEEKPTENLLEEFKKLILEKISHEYKVHPVMACGRHKTKDYFRFQFIIRGKQIFPLSRLLKTILKTFKKPSTLKVLIDVDPLNTFF
ncbi:MAG TPA: primosomal protein N', partial [Chlamydiales bacterium]|nr:primosomal protein N' [Chlamydiales bacterium]